MDIYTQNISSEKEEKRFKLRRQAKRIREIAVGSLIVQAQAPGTYTVSLTVGLIQGLKGEGGFKRGIKAGLMTYSIVLGTNVVFNLAKNIDDVVYA